MKNLLPVLLVGASTVITNIGPLKGLVDTNKWPTNSFVVTNNDSWSYTTVKDSRHLHLQYVGFGGRTNEVWVSNIVSLVVFDSKYNEYCNWSIDPNETVRAPQFTGIGNVDYHPITTNWTGYWIPPAEFGLRSDGVVVWRTINDKSTPPK